MLVWRCTAFAPSERAVKAIRRYKAQHPTVTLWVNKDTFVCVTSATRLQDSPVTKWFKEHKAVLDLERLIKKINELTAFKY